MVRILDISERLDNIESFLSRKNSSPVIGFYLGDYFVFKTYKHAHNLLGNKDLKPGDIDIKGLLTDYEYFFNENKNLPGSSIWGAEPLWSIPWMEAILGASIEVSKDSYTATARTNEVTLESGEKGTLFIDKTWESKLLDYIKRLVDFSNDRFPVVAPLLRGPSDLLPVLYGLENTIYKIVEKPELIHKILKEITDYYLELREKIFKILPLYYGGSFIYCRNIWLPGKSFPLQEDAAGSIMSPEIYKNFLFKLDCKVINEYPNVFYHLHSGTHKVILDTILTNDKLKVIEIWLDLTGPTINELLPDFKKILDAGKSLYIWSEEPMDQIEYLINNLPENGRGVFIEIKTPSRKDAIQKMEKIENFIEK